MKKKLPIIGIFTVMLLGICVFLYPVVSALLAKMTQSSTIAYYKSAVDNLSEKKIKQMLTDANSYNESLYGSAVLSDPFGDSKIKDSSKIKSLLKVNEVLGYIEISKINLYLPIYYGTSEAVLKKGVGLLENTSFPVGGLNTHSVLSGHRGLPSATLFTDLDQIAEGDVFYIHVLNKVLAYQVDQIKVVEPSVTSDLTIVKGKDYVTLVTCTPYGVNSHRLLIRGARIAYEPEQIIEQVKPNVVNEVVIVPTFFILLAVFPIVVLIRKKRRKG